MKTLFKCALLMLFCTGVMSAYSFTYSGSLDQSGPSVDLYQVHITDWKDFSAQTLPTAFGISDTELFLFDATGLAVFGNDDMGGSDPLSVALSCLPSADASNPCGYDRDGFGPIQNGFYWLAVAYSPDMPLDAFNNPLFQAGLTSILEPTGAGALAGWDNSIYTQPDFDNNKYVLQITGVPEPSTLLLLSSGLGIGLLRKKRSS